MMKTRLNARPVPIQIPWGREEHFLGMIDLVEMKAVRFKDDSQGAEFEVLEIPAEMKEEVAHARERVIEAACESSDDLLHKYLEGKALAPAEIRQALRKGMIALHFTPVLCGAAFKNKGVQQLLDAIVDYLPSPMDVPPVEGTLPDGKTPVVRRTSDNEPFSALVFKIMTDPFVGQLSFIRVYSGKLASGERVLSSIKGNSERIGRLLQMHANKREEIKEVWAGDIAAVVGLRNAQTGDTICDEKSPIVLEPMDFPEPVIKLAIEPKTKADQEKLGTALGKLAQEDPTSNGRITFRDHHGSVGARVRCGRQRRQAPGGLQGDHPPVGQGRGQVHQADRRPRAVRPRQARGLAPAPRQRLRVP